MASDGRGCVPSDGIGSAPTEGTSLPAQDSQLLRNGHVQACRQASIRDPRAQAVVQRLAPASQLGLLHPDPTVAVDFGPAYERWDPVCEGVLLDWLEMSGQYQQFCQTGRKRDNGSTSSSGQKKTEVVKIIFDYCCARDVFKTTAQISNKIKHLEGSYRRASDFLCTTGAGLITNEERLEITGIRDKVLRLCPLWERLTLDTVLSHLSTAAAVKCNVQEIVEGWFIISEV